MIFKRRQTEQRQERAAVPVFVPLECHSEMLVPRVVRESVPRLWAHRQEEEGKEWEWGAKRKSWHEVGGGVLVSIYV